MKVRITKHVNLRTGVPEVLPNNNPGDLYFSPGDVVEVAETVVGDKHKDIDKWYKLVDGGFIWSGAAEEGISLTKNKFPSTEPNAEWLNFLNLAEIWNISKGRNVNIAILDSGINSNNKLITDNLFDYSSSGKQIKSYKNLIDNGIDVTDLSGHGSHCASLVSSKNSFTIVSVAPESKLFIGKITDQGGLDDFSQITKGIKWASDIPEVDIISISIGLSDPNENDPTLSALRDAINVANKNKKIIVAAIGNARNDPSPLFPALFENCISVGATDSLGRLWEGNVNYPDVDIYTPGFDIYAHTNEIDGPKPRTGTSQAAAITSGIIALIVSKLKDLNKPYNFEIIHGLLKNHSDQVNGSPSKALISPLNYFKNL